MDNFNVRFGASCFLLRCLIYKVHAAICGTLLSYQISRRLSSTFFFFFRSFGSRPPPCRTAWLEYHALPTKSTPFFHLFRKPDIAVLASAKVISSAYVFLRIFPSLPEKALGIPAVLCYAGDEPPAAPLFLIIAVFKIKAHIRKNETTLSSQKAKHSERRVGSHSEEHPETLP